MSFCFIDPHQDTGGSASGIEDRHPRETRTRRGKKQRARLWRRRGGAIDQDRERSDAAGDFQRHGVGLSTCGGEIEACAVRREHDMQIGARARSPAWLSLKMAERRRQFGIGRHQHTVRRARQCSDRSANSGENIKQDWSRSVTPNQARHRRAVRPTDPNANSVPAVKADRPRVAVAIAGAGLERDPPRGSVLRRR